MADPHPLRRLPWQKDPERGGFVAFPNGRRNPGQVVAIRFAHERPTDARCWVWSVQWDGIWSRQGQAANKQEAANLATIAWAECMATVEAGIAAEAALDARLAAIDDGRADPLSIGVAEASSEQLIAINWKLRRRLEADMKAGTLSQGSAELLKSISAELFRRRTRG